MTAKLVSTTRKSVSDDWEVGFSHLKLGSDDPRLTRDTHDPVKDNCRPTPDNHRLRGVNSRHSRNGSGLYVFVSEAVCRANSS